MKVFWIIIAILLLLFTVVRFWKSKLTQNIVIDDDINEPSEQMGSFALKKKSEIKDKVITEYHPIIDDDEVDGFHLSPKVIPLFTEEIEKVDAVHIKPNDSPEIKEKKLKQVTADRHLTEHVKSIVMD